MISFTLDWTERLVFFMNWWKRTHVHIYILVFPQKTNSIIGRCTLSTVGKRYLFNRAWNFWKSNSWWQRKWTIQSWWKCFEFFWWMFCCCFKDILQWWLSRTTLCMRSSIQVTRKWFYYLEFGLIPLLYSLLLLIVMLWILY